MGATLDSVKTIDRRSFMKVSVYKDPEGALSVLVQASVGSGLAPVLLSGITLENIQEKVLPLVISMKRPRGSPREDPLA